MRSEDLRQHLRKRPFAPIRLFVSDGSTYDIRHPEMLLIGRSEVIIGLTTIDEELPDRFAFLDPVHITRVEPVNGSGKS